MKKRELILILTGILFFIFFGSFASAVTNVTACGTLGSAGEYYTLNQSIESTETCITIGANNIVLDCAGYNITYSVNGVSSKRGIYAATRNNITIKNCNIIDGNFSGGTSRYGIYLYSTNNSNVINNSINTSSSTSLIIYSSWNNSLSLNVANSLSGLGFSLGSNSTNNTVSLNNFSSISAFAMSITSSHNNTFFANIANSTDNSAIYIYSSSLYNTFIENSAFSVWGIGIFSVSGSVNNIFISNNASSSFLYGIRISGSNSILIGNTGYSGNDSGIIIYSSSGNTLINNEGIADSGKGIYLLDSSNNNISYNYASGAYGYYFVSSSNTIISDCNYTSGADYDVFFVSNEGSVNNMFINCSYSTEDVNGAGNYLIRKWYYDANVTHTNGTIMDNVNLTITNSSGVPIYSVLTDSNGNINRTTLTEYVNLGGTKTYSGVYILSISKTGYLNNSRTYNLENIHIKNIFEVLKYPLPFSINFPYSNMKEVIQRDANFTILGNVSGNIEGDSNIVNFTVEYSGTSSGKYYFTQFSNESFNLSLPLDGGVYDLNIYDSDNPNVSLILENIYVGDIILVMGQSNAVYTGSYPATSMVPDWPVVLVKATTSSPPAYNSTTATQIVNLANTYRDARMAYNISLTENIPVMVFNFAVGGTEIENWQNSSEEDYYNIAVKHIRNYTRGTMNIKLVYWYQGESDITYYNLTRYYNLLSTLVNNSFLDMNILSSKFVTGQILKGASDAVNPFLVRKAQQDAWYNLENVSRGPITYDIQMAPGEVHFDTDENRQEFAERMEKSVLYSVYNVGEDYPIVNNVYIINSNLLHVNFSKSGLEISNWNGSDTISKAYGFNLSDGINYIDDANIVSTSVSGNILVVNFNSSISNMENISICNAFSCYGKNVVRNSGNNLPMEIVYNISLTASGQYVCEVQGKYWYSNSCNANPQSTTEGSSPGFGIFRPSQNNLANGYAVKIKKTQKVEIPLGENKKQIVVESVNGEEVVVSSNGEDYNINSDNSAIDLNNDGYYDVEVSVAGKTINGYANLQFKLINEEVPSETEKEQNENIFDEIPKAIKEMSSWKIYVLSGAILILIVFWILLKRKKK